MASVGTCLRELRTRRGVSLEEIARTTRVAQRYLESLEADAYGELPAPVFVRGFIRAYCQALGESSDEALACYDTREGREPPPRPAPLPRPGASEPRTRGAIVVSFILLVVIGMALFTVALIIQPDDRAERSRTELGPAPPPPDSAGEPATSTPPVAAPLPPAPGIPAVAAPAAPPVPAVAASPPPPAEQNTSTSLGQPSCNTYPWKPIRAAVNLDQILQGTAATAGEPANSRR